MKDFLEILSKENGAREIVSQKSYEPRDLQRLHMQDSIYHLLYVKKDKRS